MNRSVSREEEEVTVAAFQRWLKVARRGDKFAYHRGHLAADREDVQMIPGLGQFVRIIHEPFNSLGDIAWHHHLKGDVVLAQKRLPDKRGFEYIAFKR